MGRQKLDRTTPPPRRQHLRPSPKALASVSEVRPPGERIAFRRRFLARSCEPWHLIWHTPVNMIRYYVTSC